MNERTIDTNMGPVRGKVNLFGSNLLQNKLLSRYLEETTGLKSAWRTALDLDESVLSAVEGDACIALIDCYKTDLPRLWSRIAFGKHTGTRCAIVLFNVNSEQGLEKEALDRGIRGIFYEHDDLEVFQKGIMAIAHGELWYSRETLSKCLLQQRRFEKISKDSIAVTPREKEILIKIASGASNKEIASTLCISTHTVKSHIYNIYKKINVPNRLQAILWTLKHL